MTIAIIGAGLAGLSAAAVLKAGGVDVRLFDKGRGAGGRMSTRRAETPMGVLRWDHGAQYFTARDGAFAEAIEDWVRAGVAAQWRADFRVIEASGQSAKPLKDMPRYVGAPSMNAILKHMASGHDVSWERRVLRIKRDGVYSQLIFEDGSVEGGFDAVIVAVPAEQAVDLLEGGGPEMATVAANITSAPCWAVMLAFDVPTKIAFDGAKVTSGPLAWVARNSVKPGRKGGETWVLHASPDWSRTNIERDKEDITDALVSAFLELTDVSAPVFAAAHCWRYAQVEAPVGHVLWAPEAGIGACGDWCLGGKVEAAWLSGKALAEEVLAG